MRMDSSPAGSEGTLRVSWIFPRLFSFSRKASSFSDWMVAERVSRPSMVCLCDDLTAEFLQQIRCLSGSRCRITDTQDHVQNGLGRRCRRQPGRSGRRGFLFSRLLGHGADRCFHGLLFLVSCRGLHGPIHFGLSHGTCTLQPFFVLHRRGCRSCSLYRFSSVNGIGLGRILNGRLLAYQLIFRWGKARGLSFPGLLLVHRPLFSGQVARAPAPSSSRALMEPGHEAPPALPEELQSA